ncbi:hypothetical protein B7P43_G08562, partial [Cryptotermes secundus]
CLKKTVVYKWVTRFSEGRESVTDEERLGRPATSRTEENFAKVHQILRKNCWLTVRSIVEQANIDILAKDLDIRKPSITFFMFQKIKEILKGRHFDDIDDIRSNRRAVLQTIPQNTFQNCFKGWTRHWHWCIASKVEHSEGNHRDIQQ